MIYEGTVYRPPSEAESLILQVTIGCARNQCTFCSMYKDKKFRMRTMDEILLDIQYAAKYYRHAVRRVFFADGDALIVQTKDLLSIINAVSDAFPALERITAYGAPKDVLQKTPQELKLLRKAGLEMIYMGAESGCDQVLTAVKKAASKSDLIEAGLKLKEAGMKCSITLISGLGGRKLLKPHAIESAEVISAIKPEYASLLTLLIEPGTELYEQQKSGAFLPLDGADDVLTEMKLFLSNIDSEGTVFRANHASNYLPIGGTLNTDIPAMIKTIDNALKNRSFRPDFYRQL